jgi:hypothetical protein
MDEVGTVTERDPRQDRRPIERTTGAIVSAEAAILRRYADHLAATRDIADARAAIERHVIGRVARLDVDGTVIREDHVEQNAGTLRIRYLQHRYGLPVLGAGLEVSADIASAAILTSHSTIDEALDDAPDPRSALPVESVTPLVLAPFAARYAAAAVVGVRTGYLRDRTRPPLPRRANRTATHELLRTGCAPDGRLHLVHEFSVETTMPFERFRVVADATDGSIRSIELLSSYLTEAGSVYVPPQLPASGDPAAPPPRSLATQGPPRDHPSMHRAAPWTGTRDGPRAWNALRTCSALRLTVAAD